MDWKLYRTIVFALVTAMLVGIVFLVVLDKYNEAVYGGGRVNRGLIWAPTHSVTEGF